MRRLLCLLCALALCAATGWAAAEDADFTLHFTLYPEHFPDAMQPLAGGLAELCEVSVLRGHYAAQGDAFVLSADAEVNGCVLPLDVRGAPSHWRIASPALGDTALLLNNLALLEFGLKAENHLGIPLQKACLLVPYAHTSAWAVLAEELSPLLPAGDGESVLDGEACLDLLDALIALAETDRTVRCYLDALGIRTDALAELADDFDQGVTVIREGASLRWVAGDVPLMAFEHGETGMTLDASLTGLTIGLEFDTHAEDFRFSLEARGALLNEDILICADGMSAPDCLAVTVYNADKAPLVTMQADLASSEGLPFPVFTAASLDGVNVLSVSGETLAGLMAEIAPTLLPRCIALIAAIPAQAVQSLMDALDNSGILPLLADALLYGDLAY